MDKDLNLNTSAGLPDGTTAAQTAHPDHHANVSASDLRRGYSKPGFPRLSSFDPDITGENQVGDPFSAGGFLGRPRGNAR